MNAEEQNEVSSTQKVKTECQTSLHHLKIHSIPDEYKIAIERQEKESDRFWARSNIMLLVQGALISFYISLQGKDSLFGVITVLEGVLLAVIWLAVLAKGKTYVSRWDEVINGIEEEAIVSRELQFPLASLYRNVKEGEASSAIPFSRKSTTKLMQYAVISILVFWLSALTLTLTVGIEVADTSEASIVEEGVVTQHDQVAQRRGNSVATQPVEQEMLENVETKAPAEAE